ncbi:hypothetical protein Tco_0774534 [Tanacetum coccineum]|uniref:Integrase, catalytic region, zinc finger, CCHC-type, peptidase aspartic, catalytic n=1 Tax=Tanacetum coccineum TaxID=301880 RepID=A0ABQ4ZT22_9ASTR
MVTEPLPVEAKLIRPKHSKIKESKSYAIVKTPVAFPSTQKIKGRYGTAVVRYRSKALNRRPELIHFARSAATVMTEAYYWKSVVVFDAGASQCEEAVCAGSRNLSPSGQMTKRGEKYFCDAKDKEIEDLKSQLLKAKAAPRGEFPSAPPHVVTGEDGLLTQGRKLLVKGMQEEPSRRDEHGRAGRCSFPTRRIPVLEKLWILLLPSLLLRGHLPLLPALSSLLFPYHRLPFSSLLFFFSILFLSFYSIPLYSYDVGCDCQGVLIRYFSQDYDNAVIHPIWFGEPTNRSESLRKIDAFGIQEWPLNLSQLADEAVCCFVSVLVELSLSLMRPYGFSDIQCAGSDTRPPMLDKADFASWQQRIRLYCRGKDNGVNILKSIDEGPFQMGTTRVTAAEGTEGPLNLGPERPRVYSDLSQDEKDRYNADIRATNIILQGLPKDIYSLINHYTDAKDIWDNNKGETIHNYYVRKLINDMRNIKMTMSKIQLNSKFVNNMLPEWGRFVTAVKLNKGLKDSNFDQLYAYLKQHEVHANENKMMLERLTQQTVDPLALMSNVSPQHYHPQSSTNPPTTYHQPQSADTSQSDLGLSPTDNLIENLTNTLALLTQSYKTFLPQTNNQLRTSSNPRNQATVQDGRVVVQNVQGRQNRGQGNNARGAGAVGYGRAHITSGECQSGFKLDRLSATSCNGVGQCFDEDGRLIYPVQDLALNVDNVFQADDCDAYDSDVDEAPTAQTLFMANLSSTNPVYDEADLSYDSDVLSELQDRDHYQESCV